MSTDLIDLIQRLGQPRVLVLGDLMLDRYVWGNAERISQEAPVVLLRADRREERLGGASSVANLLAALGAKVSLAGVIGEDADGRRIRDLLTELGIDQEGVVADPKRPTTVKERYIGRAQDRHAQQMLRVDYETREAISGPTESELFRAMTEQLRRADIVLVSDYDKGVCSPAMLRHTIAAAKQRGLRILADPIRGQDYRKYHGCTALTPNRLEASLATGHEIIDIDTAWTAGDELRQELDLDAAIITLDKDGMALCRDGQHEVFPTRPRQVYDITGAGDMVLAVLGLALAAGADYPEALQLANVAGGLEVEKIGVATVTREEILLDLFKAVPGAEQRELTSQKVRPLPRLLDEIELRRRNGQRIAFTNGCFDVLHAGHVQYLHEARNQADVLIVGMNTDASVRQLKGPDRPVNPADARATVLAGLQCVDYVIDFDEPTPEQLIEAIRPDVLVKGADYQKQDVVGAEFVESYGGRVYLAALREGLSTTSLIQKMRAA